MPSVIFLLLQEGYPYISMEPPECIQFLFTQIP